MSDVEQNTPAPAEEVPAQDAPAQDAPAQEEEAAAAAEPEAEAAAAPVEEEAPKKPEPHEELKEAHARAKAADDYAELKPATQALKEALVRLPGRVNNLAGELKAEARAVGEEQKKKLKEQEESQKQKAYLQSQLDDLRSDAISARVDKLKKDIAVQQAKRREYQDRLDRAVEEDKKPFANTSPGTRYVAFLSTRGEMIVKSTVARARFEEFKVKGPPKGADLDSLMEDVYAEEANLERARMELDKLTALADGLKKDGFKAEVDLAQLHESLSLTSTALADWKLVINQDLQRKAELDRKVDKLFREQNALLSWCTTQQQSLQLLTKGDDIVDFCTSLHDMVATMLENMTVVQDMSEPHLPNALVTAGNVDLNNAWVKLQVTSYEMLNKVLYEKQLNSGLKDAVSAFAEFQKNKVKGLLDAAEELLETPENPKEKELVGSALDLCKELQTEFQPHLILMEHLADFEVRLELIEEQYQPMIKTVLSSLTSLVQKIRLGTQVTFKGRAEYETHINDLNDIIAARDTNSTSWAGAKDIVNRIMVDISAP